GGYILKREQALGIARKSVLGVAHQCGVPIYTSSPGDSSIGMNVAEQALTGSQLRFDASADVNETSAIVFHAKTHRGRSGVPILAAYALARRKPRRLKRLYHKRPDMMRALTEAYQEAKADRDARAEAATAGRRP